tara:strand:- start:5009 stop:6400 length:1392 start_codon:yes stop_codon:yes gene_type:complete
MSVDKYSGSHTIEAASDVKLQAGGDTELTSQGSLQLTSQGSLQLTSQNDVDMTASNHIRIETTAEDVHLDAAGNVLIMAEDKVQLTSSSDDVTISADNDVSLAAENEMRLNSSGDITIDSSGGDITLDPSSEVVIQGILVADSIRIGGVDNPFEKTVFPEIGTSRISPEENNESIVMETTGNSTFGDVVHIRNGGNSSDQDGLNIDINWGSADFDADNTNKWIKFDFNSDEYGSVRGVSPGTEVGGYLSGTGYYPVVVSKNVDIDYTTLNSIIEYETDNGHPHIHVDQINQGQYIDRVAELDNVYGVQFVSGTGDFGEFFELGDKDEWDQPLKESGIAGIQEGIVVWVIGGKFYKNNIDQKGIAMLVTKRAIIAGGGVLGVTPDSGRLGEILSFCGVLPVIIEGRADIGDLIVPVRESNHCIAVPKASVTFEQYKESLGTVLEEYTDKLKSKYQRIFCAVGVK